MPRFALKLLLTNLMIRHATSRRIGNVQAVTALLTFVLLACVGLYIWAHGSN
jgi:hypothetical protein